MQIKTALQYPLTAVKTNNKITCPGEDVETLEPMYAAGGNVEWYSCGKKQYGSSSQN